MPSKLMILGSLPYSRIVRKYKETVFRITRINEDLFYSNVKDYGADRVMINIDMSNTEELMRLGELSTKIFNKLQFSPTLDDGRAAYTHVMLVLPGPQFFDVGIE
jgi:hypothetical protein